jgi:hypothetical protein
VVSRIEGDVKDAPIKADVVERELYTKLPCGFDLTSLVALMVSADTAGMPPFSTLTFRQRLKHLHRGAALRDRTHIVSLKQRCA